MEEAAKRRDLGWERWKTLGDVYLEKGDEEKAFECYSKAIDIYLSLKEENRMSPL